MTGIIKFLTESEMKAKQFLKEINWKPQRTGYFNYDLYSGLPDFICSHERFVEVKKENFLSGGINVGQNQFKAFKKLNRCGKKTYLLVISNNLKQFDIYEIKHVLTNYK